MARPVGWRWSPIPQHLVKAADYLDFAVPVNAGSLLDRLYAYAADRYGIFRAAFRPLRNETGLEGSAAEFEAALAALEAKGFIFLWTSPGGTSLGIVANYSCDGGLPASLFHRRPALDTDCVPPDAVASACGWTPPDDDSASSGQTHEKPPCSPCVSRENEGGSSQDSHDKVGGSSGVCHDKPPRRSRETRANGTTNPHQSQTFPSRVETETETETKRVTRAAARAPEHAHTHTRALAREGSQGSQAPPPDIPPEAEALVGELLVTLATRRQAYAPLTVQERDHAKALVKTEATFGASLRSLAAMHPDAWPEVAPRFLQGGDLEDKLSKGYRPKDTSYLRSVLEGWTPDQRRRGQDPPGRANGRAEPGPVQYLEPDPVWVECYGSGDA